MCRIVASALLALSVVACGGSDAPTAPTPTGPSRFTLSGTVTDGATSAGLSGATVAVVDGPNTGRSATTNSTGAYALTNLEPSGFTVRISAPDYGETFQPVTLTADRQVNAQLARRSLSGSWSGTWALSIGGQRFTNQVTSATLVQTGDQLSGTFVAADGANGGLNGTVAGDRFTGSMRVDTASDNPSQRCAGSAPSLVGTVSATSITLTAPSLALDFCRGEVTNIELRLSR